MCVYMYIHICVYIHIYIYEGLKALPPRSNEHTYNIAIWVSTQRWPIKRTRAFGEVANSEPGHGKYKMSLEHLLMPENKKMPPKRREPVQRRQQ